MKKRLIVCTALIAVIVLLCLAGCGLVGNSSDSLANNGSSASSGSTTKSKYSGMTKTELEAALAKYEDICEKQADLLEDYQQIVTDFVSQTGSNIGAYATTLVDCVMNIACAETKYYNLSCQGTGFIISDDGYVITNNHVIYYEANQTDWFGRIINSVKGVYSSITAVFDSESTYYGNGTVYNLQFVYRDPDYDLALLKIVEDVPVGDAWSSIPFYDGNVKRGDALLVLGNADGFGLSATAGLVSATGKSFTDSSKLTFIQTDAAINGGNSGGPAINIYGALVGVVNSKFVSTNIENMGFAIELDKVETFITDAEADAAEKGTPITVAYKTKSGAAQTTENQEAAAA